MDREDIQKVKEWFVYGENSDFSTYYNGNEFAVGFFDIGGFCDFLNEYFPDLIALDCKINKDGIWFTEKDLETAREY